MYDQPILHLALVAVEGHIITILPSAADQQFFRTGDVGNAPAAGFDQMFHRTECAGDIVHEDLGTTDLIRYPVEHHHGHVRLEVQEVVCLSAVLSQRDEYAIHTAPLHVVDIPDLFLLRFHRLASDHRIATAGSLLFYALQRLRKKTVAEVGYDHADRFGPRLQQAQCRLIGLIIQAFGHFLDLHPGLLADFGVPFQGPRNR